MHISIGSKGLAKQVLPLYRGNARHIFFDDTEGSDDNLHYHKVIHNLNEIKILIDEGIHIKFSVCIGNPKWRKHFYDLLIEMGAYPHNIISEKSSIAYFHKLGEGNIILDFALIETDASIGNGNLINCYAGIFHDVKIGDHNEIMPGAKILGNAKIGDRCRIGTNSSILPGVTICDDVLIGAGAVVNRDITESGTYVGVPAKKKEINKSNNLKKWHF
jgi:sugar O-acyltransferase (sialic acid O-acetyltransferase NeuD family)